MKHFPDQIFICFDDKATNKAPHTLTEYNEDIFEELNSQGWGVFFTPNSFYNGQRRNEHIKKINAIFGDLDASKTEYNETQEQIDRRKNTLIAKLKEYCEPSTIIWTKNGIQPIWYVDEPNTDADTLMLRKQITEGLIDWSKTNGALGDEVKDAARLIRLPGFNHHKKEPYLIKEVEGNNKIYTLKELQNYFWREEEKYEKKTDIEFVDNPLVAEMNKIDIKDVVIAVWKELGHEAIFDKTGHLIIDGKATATFQGRQDDRQYIATTSADYPAKGNKVTYVAETLKISNKEAFRWIVNKFDIKEPIELENKIGKLKPIILNDLVNKVLPEARWLINQLIPTNGVTILSSPPGFYKTWLIIQMAISAVRKEKTFDKFDSSSTGILMINEENWEGIIQERLKELGVRKDEHLNIHFFNQEGIKFNDLTVEEILKICQENKIDLIIIDSLTRIHDLDENSATDIKKVYDQFKKFTTKGISILTTHHHRKSSLADKGNENIGEQMRGSTDLQAMSDCHLIVSKRNDNLVIHQAKQRLGKVIEPFELLIEIGSEGSGKFSYSGEWKGRNRLKPDIQEGILEIIRIKGTATFEDMSAGTGMANKALRENVGFLEDSGTIYSKRGGGRGGKKVYYMPGNEPSLFNSDI